MHEMVFAVRDEMGRLPRAERTADRVAKVVLAEEEHFGTHAAAGIGQLDAPSTCAQGRRRRPMLPGATRSISTRPTACRWTSWSTQRAIRASPSTWPASKQARKEEQARARASWKGGSQEVRQPGLPRTAQDRLRRLRQLNSQHCEVLALVKDGVGVPRRAGEKRRGRARPHQFYADSGGQVGDTGWLYSDDHNTVVAEVRGCTKPVQGVFAHRVICRQPIGSATMSTRSSTATSAAPPAATTPARICCMRRCARCSASM